MKLTRSKNAKRAVFYRDMTAGSLVGTDKIQNRSENLTDVIIEKLPYKKSYLHRILSRPSLTDSKNKKNPLYNMIESHVDSQKPLHLDMKIQADGSVKNEEGKLLAKNRENFCVLININLSEFGRNIRISENVGSLSELLMNHYDGKDISDDLEKLRAYIKSKIVTKKSKLIKSIQNNKIPFQFQENELEPNSPRMKILFSLLSSNGLNLEQFESFKTAYKYTDLKEQIQQIIRENKNFPYKKVYQEVLKYDVEFRARYNDRSEEEKENNWFYAIEVKHYFQRLLMGKKNISNKQYRLGPNKLNYESEEFVFRQVRRYIINQLVKGLIQYGKIIAYTNPKEKQYIKQRKITSDFLTQIQVQEAFKKQMVLSVAWAVKRLNYFYDYASQSSKDTESDMSNDIFSHNKYIENFENELSAIGTTADNSKIDLLRAKIGMAYMFHHRF